MSKQRGFNGNCRNGLEQLCPCKMRGRAALNCSMIMMHCRQDCVIANYQSSIGREATKDNLCSSTDAWGGTSLETYKLRVLLLSDE